MTAIATYREKLREVEARRFDGTRENMMSVVSWIQENGYILFDTFTPAPGNGVSVDLDTGFLQIVNVPSGYIGKAQYFAQKGDWVVRDACNSMSVMKDEEFCATYECVEEEIPENEEPNAEEVPE